MITFWYNMLDTGGCPINPHPLDLEAKSLGHALQKVAACLDDDCVEVYVWMGYTQEARIRRVK